MQLKPCQIVTAKPLERYGQANWYLLDTLRERVTYTVETSNLAPTCDTVMLLLDENLNKMAVNDDCNGHRGSCLSFVSTGAQVWVRISSFKWWAVSTGNSFQISVFSQECLNCNPGSSALVLGADFLHGGCSVCVQGTWSAGGAGQCLNLECTPGSAPTKEGAVSARDGCSKCDQGLYSEGGSGRCIPMRCDPGFYANFVPLGATHS